MSTDILGQSDHGHNGNGSANFLSVKSVSLMLGCSTSQTRLLCNAGILRHYRSIGNHRFIEKKSVLEYIGEDIEENDLEEKKIGLYVRVSTTSDKQKTSVINQKNDLIKYVIEKENIKESDIDNKVVWFIDRCSSFSLMDNNVDMLLNWILKDKLYKAIICRKNRLGRQQSYVKMFQHCCSLKNVELVFVENDLQTPSDNEEMTLEIIDMVQVYGNRASSRVGAEKSRKNISIETRKRISELWSKKIYNIKDIQKILEEEGYQYEKVNGENGVIPYSILRRIIVSNKIKLDNREDIYQNRIKDINPIIKEFIDTQLIKDEKLREDISPIYDRFCKWSTDKGYNIPKRIYFGMLMSRMFQRSRVNSMNYVVGVKLRKNGE